ncbi:NnrU family protein [Gemmobacter serpentinus]|uniref:NnrU family protein n=1 Tax=Gemmobacter serpentinus TaxID=2652247 RepID=UPI00124D540B|nr:NnrU family protein [Gemmobacter serpentinus]
MFLLATGVILWIAAHLFKRLAPGRRAAMGDAGRLAVTVTVIASVILMVIGYRMADGAFYWGRTPALVGINNLLMLVSVYLFAASGMKTWIARRLRHPMLVGVVLWSIAHLLVNGDTPSFLLFGGIGAWALVQMALINRDGAWVPPAAKPAKFEAMALAGTVLVFGAIAGLHYALGYPAFG